MNDAVGASSAFPLPLLQSGENAVIVKVGGRGELHRHLETLGFVEGRRHCGVGGGGRPDR